MATSTSSPWKRKRSKRGRGYYKIPVHSFTEEFDLYIDANMDLDFDTKKAALEAAPSVVSLVSLTGGNAFFMGSGTIVECVCVNGSYESTILTSASLLKSSPGVDTVEPDIEVNVYVSDGKLFEGKVVGYDLHYNVAVIGLKSDAPLPTAKLRYLDDYISIDPSNIPRSVDKAEGSKSFQLRPHSYLFNLCPGDMVFAVGRYFDPGYNKLMVASGQFSVDCCQFDCRELFRANCKISKCGIGGPLVNRYGEVIGVNFYDSLCTPFLPINLAYKFLEHLKKYGNRRFFRPWLGMELTNLFAASLFMLGKFLQKFPNNFKGIFVEEVMEESPAEIAGILPGDVIIKCSEKLVRGVLEFHEIIWEKAGEPVEIVVLREEDGASLKLTLVAVDTSADLFNSWPIPEQSFRYSENARWYV